MGAWLSGIVGIICLGLLLEIVLPEGQTTKYVRGAFSLLVILVVVAPLPKLFGGDFKLDSLGVEYLVDKSYVFQLQRQYEDEVEQGLEKALAESGYNCTVQVVAKEGYLKEILSAQIKINGLVIDGQGMNTHISRVKLIACDYLKADVDQVEVVCGGG
jgi:stage III sporulation protein AF